MDTDAQQYDEAERDRSSRPDEGGWRSRSRSVLRTLTPTAAVLLALLLVSAFLVQPFLIPSGSMKPTLAVGDRVLVNKLAYRFGNHPARGDVVVFDGTGSFVEEEAQEGTSAAALLRKAGAAVGMVEPAETDYVKRVIGVGGDRVRCCDKRGRIEVNGTAVSERYLHPGDEPSAVPFDIEVPQGRLWMMGDHRANSSDSRDHLGEPGGGSVPLERVIGRVDWIGWPAERWTSLRGGAGGHG